MEANREHWKYFRQSVPAANELAYFDHAAVAPIPAPCADAIRGWAQQAAVNGDTVWPEWAATVESLRNLAARLINAEADEIALVPNTTTGISFVAEGFPWREGDNLVTLANEFPSNQYPWMNLGSRGVETRRVEVDGVAAHIDQIMAACDDRTRMISVSWVGYATGWRMDVAALAEMAHQRGILLFLDAIQGLGVFPLDVKRMGVDFLAADGHKWMMGPEGAGIMYINREHLNLLRPLNVGWNSVVHSHDFTRCELNIRPAASRYEGGSQNMVGMIGLRASLQLLADVGLSTTESPIAERILQINRLAAERLLGIGAQIASRLDDERASGILSFSLPDRDLDETRKRCLAAGVVLSLRAGNLRISPHGYASEEDVDRLIDALAAT